MSFLSRITVGRLDAARERLTDAYAWHQRVWKSFPDTNGERRAFLSRIESKGDVIEALVLSFREPEPQDWALWEIREVPDAFLGLDRYYFSLRANPTVKRVVRDTQGERRKNGRRTRVIDPDELASWIAAKAEASGFAIEPGTLRFEPPVDQRSLRKGSVIVHSRVDFTGVLGVKDRPLFEDAWRAGIGPARAFGFGMMLLKPLG